MCLSAAQWGGHGALPGMNRTDNDFRQVHFAANSLPVVLVSFLAGEHFLFVKNPCLVSECQSHCRKDV